MSDQKIEDYIVQELTGNAEQNALEFIEHLRANEMQFERGKGYWEDKLYWFVKYNGEYVCFILIGGSEAKDNSCIVWSDDSGSNWFCDLPLDEHIKEISWKYVDFCENCGSCNGGKRKTIFGKEFDNVCRTVFRFDNPDNDALVFMKKMIEMRKNDILLS